MYYKHDMNIQYPEKPDEHMLKVKRKRKILFDENYVYRRRDFGYKFLRVIYFLALNLIVFPLMRLTHGLRIHGKENLRKHKAELKSGAITVSNHVFMWDYLCVLKAIRLHLAYFPAWKTNVEGPCGRLVRMSGGIPIPEGNIHATMKFKKEMESVIEDGKWLHVFPEGSLWFFYPDIRPLKNAVFKMATKYRKPLIPITMSFRPRRGLPRLFGKAPSVDLHIGEPLYADETLPFAEAADKLHRETYHVMQVMNGITPDMPNYRHEHICKSYEKTM